MGFTPLILSMIIQLTGRNNYWSECQFDVNYGVNSSEKFNILVLSGNVIC